MKFTFREGTIDSLMFEGIFKYDEYRLPARFSENDIIIDIGAHIGFFTYAVLQRGARNIHAFEPDSENYKMALEHLKDYIEQKCVVIRRAAVWRSDVRQGALIYSGYSLLDTLLNTGGGNVLGNKAGTLVPAIPFDTIILDLTKNAQKRIRLLKLDCEGSEWPILFTSSTLHLIDEICGEFHEIGGEYDTYLPYFSLKGFDRFTSHQLIQFLSEKGFNITYSRRREANGSPSRYGMFFATRAISDSTIIDAKVQAVGAPAPSLRQVECVDLSVQDQMLLRVLEGHTGWVVAVAFSPDGSKVLTGSYDRTVRLWETISGQMLLTLQGHSGAILSVVFSPDGSKVLTGSDDDTARIWETTSGRMLATLQGHTGWVVAVAFSPDGSKVLTGSDDGTARIWETTSGRVLTAMEGHTRWIVTVAFSPDGSKVLTGSYDRTVRLWETASGRNLATLEGHTDAVTNVVFSPDGSKVLTGSYDRTVRLWETASGRELMILKGHSGAILSVVFSPDGSKVLTGSDDDTARIWETTSGCMLATLQGHTDWVLAVAFSPDGSMVLTGSSDGTARLWETTSGRMLATLQGHTGVVRCLAFSPDGSMVLTGSEDRAVRLWKVNNTQTIGQAYPADL